MDSLILYLDYFNPKSRIMIFQRWINFIMGSIWIFYGFKKYPESSVSLFFIILGVIALLNGVFLPKISRPKFIVVDNDKIQTKTSYFAKPKELLWKNILSISIGSLAIKIVTKDKEEHEIGPGSLNYNQHKMLKPKLMEYAKLNQIEVT